MNEMLDRQTTEVFKSSVELEYFTRSIFEEVFFSCIQKDIINQYEAETAVEVVAGDIVDKEINKVAESIMREEGDKEYISKAIASEVISKNL